MRTREIAEWIAAAVLVAAAGCSPGTTCTASDECRENADCPSGSYCAFCQCAMNPCAATDECRADADCPAGGSCRFNDRVCLCEVPASPLSPSGIATLTGSGIASSAHFEEIEGCPGPSSFDAGLTVTVSTPGEDGTSPMQTVQQPGDQRATGTLRSDLTFVLRDASGSYDEMYVGVFERTAGTDPSEPLTAQTVIVRGVNVNGADGLLVSIDDARVDAAIGAGLFDPATQSAALTGLLEGITGACVLGVDVVLQP